MLQWCNTTTLNYGSANGPAPRPLVLQKRAAETNLVAHHKTHPNIPNNNVKWIMFPIQDLEEVEIHMT